MRYRLEAAWLCLLGRPVVFNVPTIVKGGLSFKSDETIHILSSHVHIDGNEGEGLDG